MAQLVFLLNGQPAGGQGPSQESVDGFNYGVILNLPTPSMTDDLYDFMVPISREIWDLAVEE